MSRVCFVGEPSNTCHAVCWHERNCSMRHSPALSVLGLGFVPNCFKTAAGSPKRPPKQGPKQGPKRTSNEAPGWGHFGGRLGGLSRALLGPFWTPLSGHISKHMLQKSGSWANRVRQFSRATEGSTDQRTDRPSDKRLSRRPAKHASSKQTN